MNYSALPSEYALAGCEGKKRFSSFEKASATIKRRHVLGQQKPYHCRSCAGFHIGSNAQRRHKRPKGMDE